MIPGIVASRPIIAAASGGVWDIGSMSYTGDSYAPPGVSYPQSVTFTDDGLYMFLGFDKVIKYSLSVAWDITTATEDSSSAVITYGPIRGLSFSPDGLKALAIPQYGLISDFTLSTPWDITSWTYNGYGVTTGYSDTWGLYVDPDGSRFWTVWTADDTVNEFSLSTPWDAKSTITHVKTFSTALQDSAMEGGVTFSDDGSIMITSGYNNDKVYQYDLSTPFDISTAVFSKDFSISTESGSVSGIAYANSGDDIVITDRNLTKVFRYGL